MNNLNRLKKRKQFNYIHQKGKAISGDFLTLKYIETKSKNYKVGFSVSKKVGKAVVRNKTKRRIKECFRQLTNIPQSYYYVLVAKKEIADATFIDIKNDISKIFDNFRRII